MIPSVYPSIIRYYNFPLFCQSTKHFFGCRSHFQYFSKTGKKIVMHSFYQSVIGHFIYMLMIGHSFNLSIIRQSTMRPFPLLIVSSIKTETYVMPSSLSLDHSSPCLSPSIIPHSIVRNLFRTSGANMSYDIRSTGVLKAL